MAEDALKNERKLSARVKLSDGARPSPETDHLETGRLCSPILQPNQEWNTWIEGGKSAADSVYGSTALVSSWTESKEYSENCISSSGDVNVLQHHGSPPIRIQSFLSRDEKLTAESTTGLSVVPSRSVTDEYEGADDVQTNHPSTVPDTVSGFSSRYAGQSHSELHALSHSKQRPPNKTWDRSNPEDVSPVFLESGGLEDPAEKRLLEFRYISSLENQRSVAAHSIPNTVAMDSFCTSGPSVKHCTPLPDYLLSSHFSRHGSYFHDDGLCTRSPLLVHSVIPGLPGLDPMYVHSMAGLASVCQQKYMFAIEKATPTDPEWDHGVRAPVWHHPPYAIPSTVLKEPTGLQNTLHKEPTVSAASVDCGPRLLTDHHITTTNLATLHVSSPVVTREKSYMSVNANTFPPAAACSVVLQTTHCTVMSEEDRNIGNGTGSRQLETPSSPNKQKLPWLTSPQIAYPQGHNHSSESRTPSHGSTTETRLTQKETSAAALLAEQNILLAASSAVLSAPELSCSVNVLLPNRMTQDSKLAAVKNDATSSMSVIQENVGMDCHLRNKSFLYSDSKHSPLYSSKHQDANQTTAPSSADHVGSNSSFMGEPFIKGGYHTSEQCRNQPYPLRHHTKLKKAWMTRHSKQFGQCEDQRGVQVAGHNVGGNCLNGRGEKRKAENEHSTEEGKSKQVAEERYEYTSEDEENNLHLQRVWPKPKHMESNSLTLHCGDGAIVTRQKVIVEHSHVHNGMSDALLLNSDITTEKLRASPEFILQDTPCFIMPAYIQRCRKCWPVCSPEQQEGRLPKDISCRFQHFRRLSLGRNGGLIADGFATWPEADDHLHHWIPDDGQQEGLNVSESKYLLSTLGNQFCKMVDTERDALSWTEEDGGGAVMWKKTGYRNDVCDFCCAGFFNTHWMCSKCGFQVCLQCYSSKRKQHIEEKNKGHSEWLKCTRGQDHDVRSLIAIQFVPTSVVVDLWKLLHDIQAQFDIISRCACEQKSVKDKSTQAQMLKEEDARVSPYQPLHPVSTEETPESKPPKEDVRHSTQENHKTVVKQNPVDQTTSGQRPKVSEQCTSLCDLLASTALKLSLGSVDIGMAFAPVSPMLQSYERAATILDSIIARVVERKIQEKLKGSSMVCTDTLEPRTVHSYHSRGGMLWLHNPLHKSNIRIFQESWRKHQLVLVSGSHRNMKKALWRPQTIMQEVRSQTMKIVNCRNQETATEVNSREFWERFLCTVEYSETPDCLEPILKAETELEKLKPLWMDDLYCTLPLPEYSRIDGKFNLVSYLPENTIQSQLLPKLWAAYSVKPKNYNIGTIPLTSDPSDSFSMLIHTEGTSEDCSSVLKDIMLMVEEESIDGTMKKRLEDPKIQPGALWHIYSKSDTDKIQKMSLKVLEERRRDVANGLNPTTGSNLYFDQSLRRSLHQEFGVKCHTVIQCVGDTVFLPAGSLYQVQCFASCISVSQGFLSPEHASSFLGQMYKVSDGESGCGKHGLHQLQLERLIYHAVKNAVGTLKRQRKEAHN
ncbi:probable JmjC domain-containing histone demethylation protein 2C isoform X2 [Protopterus annectens]|uniref:probable JmjC domain-containing histone demethylation protein 2C isoform X2 n=1 Tax=Protopterus annectens TaxID=7888 RepID=UPI001CFC0B6A|nr:probable JmjC domain-containing histone demethylation protein 2C isoform X2 [Protopterus annectens]